MGTKGDLLRRGEAINNNSVKTKHLAFVFRPISGYGVIFLAEINFKFLSLTYSLFPTLCHTKFKMHVTGIFFFWNKSQPPLH
jgi:hypothetical protein